MATIDPAALSPDSLLSSSFSSRFFYFDISSPFTSMNAHTRGRNDRQAGKNFTMKHPIKNGRFEKCALAIEEHEIFLGTNFIHESKVLSRKIGRDPPRQFVFKTKCGTRMKMLQQ